MAGVEYLSLKLSLGETETFEMLLDSRTRSIASLKCRKIVGKGGMQLKCRKMAGKSFNNGIEMQEDGRKSFMNVIET